MSDRPTLLEALGYPADARVIILSGDEYGECHAVNGAFFEMLAAGTMTSPSLTTVYAWASEAAAWQRAHPEVDCGVHLVLTCQHQALRWGPISRSPGLCDPHGYMWPNNEAVWEHATVAEGYAEGKAQVERFLAFGLTPSHLDPHMGAVRRNPEWLRNVYARLAREYKLPIRMAAPTNEEEAAMRAELAESGVLMSDHMRLGGGKQGLSFGEFAVRQLRELPPGVTDFYMHPAHDTPELRAAVKNWQHRLDEYAFFHRDPALKQTLEERNMTVISWKPIHELAKAGVKVRPREWTPGAVGGN